MYEDISHALLGYPLDKIRVLDTETTGLDYFYNDILQIAISDGYGNELMNTYVRPTKLKSWPDAEKVNHITPAMVKGAPTIKQLASEIKSLLEGCLVVAYNFSFDADFLYGADIFSWSDLNRGFDVMKEFAKVHGKEKWEDSGNYKYSKLVDCAKYYGYYFPPHDAMRDVEATAHCFRSLLCDKAYIPLALEKAEKSIRDLSLSMGVGAKRNAGDIIGAAESMTITGELRVGAVTQGKNKGRARLECYVNDMLVGLPHEDDANHVLYFLGIDGIQSITEPIVATIKFTREQGRLRCSYTPKTDLESEVYELAERDRPERMEPIYVPPKPAAEPQLKAQQTVTQKGGKGSFLGNIKSLLNKKIF